MTTDSGVMVPVSDSDVGQLALIQALRMLTEQNTRVANNVEKISDQVTQLAKDVAVLQAHDYKHELEIMRAVFQSHTTTSDAKIEAAVAQWRTDSLARDRRIEELLDKSLEDRRNLWLAVETIRGRLLPILAAASLFGAGVVAFVVDKVLK